MTGGREIPVIRIAELTIDTAHLDAYRSLLAEEIEASVRLEPGVLFLFAVSIKDSPDKVRVVEGYASQAAYEEHLRTSHFLKYKSETADMVLALQLVETTPIALNAKAGGISI